MSGLYQFPGGSASIVGFKLTGTSAVEIAGSSTEPTRVAWFRITEIAGGTGNLTIEVYDAATLTSYYIRYAAAMAAKATLLFEEGYPLGKNQFLRVTTGTANTADVLVCTLNPALDAGGRL